MVLSGMRGGVGWGVNGDAGDGTLRYGGGEGEGEEGRELLDSVG